MLVGVHVVADEQLHVLLKALDLVVDLDEYLGLLLHQQRALGHLQLHLSLLMVVNYFFLAHLFLGSLERFLPLSLQLESVIGEGRRLLHSASQPHLLEGSLNVVVLSVGLVGQLLVLVRPAEGNHSFMLLRGRRVWLGLGKQIKVEASRGRTTALQLGLCGVYQLVVVVQVLPQGGIVLGLMEVEGTRHRQLRGRLVSLELVGEFLVELLEVRNFPGGGRLELKESRILSLVILARLLLSLASLVVFHARRQLRQAKAELGILLHSSLSLGLGIVDHPLIELDADLPGYFPSSEGNELFHARR
mmetsp:Transcript_9389/g.14316  ORF Transcript_9389/g.14316 Transcript_9389/m.14316 type:complete len:303 (-) Transcript_9389:2370-3278(-)